MSKSQLLYLLDTNVCIVYLKGKSLTVNQRLKSLNRDDIAVCSVVKAELFYGSMGSNKPKKALQIQKAFVDQFISLPFDDCCALICGKLRAHLASAGTPIGSNDLLIASIALANNLILVTHNVKEFSRVEGLKLEDWESN
ncbi:VapC toxin family PIN domain ribonuclease [Pleurocapsa sp. CCALA 161]|uniref:type II toxin-antitoxin system tRNA(fMet)-specific endonuclease VapC n=1 Tax=Pleurocapsa sp. CCALA 161 TaxID=2107688 RepID=UPI000D06F4D2|nr:type II toxin-antitoxin system VapC family toxin [Pleurocapsa sp. CCALA 161]PSB06359.1 VapC toxin family PIN domain ribonuclease [Pleurocapsa sp. CCALA 161]